LITQRGSRRMIRRTWSGRGSGSPPGLSDARGVTAAGQGCRGWRPWPDIRAIVTPPGRRRSLFSGRQ
jgi:hypothetical protein